MIVENQEKRAIGSHLVWMPFDGQRRSGFFNVVEGAALERCLIAAKRLYLGIRVNNQRPREATFMYHDGGTFLFLETHDWIVE